MCGGSIGCSSAKQQIIIGELKRKILLPLLYRIFENTKYIDVKSDVDFIVSRMFGMGRNYRIEDTLGFQDDIVFSELFVGGCGFEFDGLFVKVKLDYENDTLVFVYPEELCSKNVVKENTELGEMVDVIDVENKNKVNLEDVNFEKYFKVYSKSQIGARMVLTPDIMEQLAVLQSKYKNNNMIFSFYKNYVYIAIEGVRLIDEQRIAEYGLSKENLYYTLKNVDNILISVRQAIKGM